MSGSRFPTTEVRIRDAAMAALFEVEAQAGQSREHAAALLLVLSAVNVAQALAPREIRNIVAHALVGLAAGGDHDAAIAALAHRIACEEARDAREAPVAERAGAELLKKRGGGA